MRRLAEGGHDERDRLGVGSFDPERSGALHQEGRPGPDGARRLGTGTTKQL
jgi:hypothetical protein